MLSEEQDLVAEDGDGHTCNWVNILLLRHRSYITADGDVSRHRVSIRHVMYVHLARAELIGSNGAPNALCTFSMVISQM